MLCGACRRQLPRRGHACTCCGAPRPGTAERTRYSLVLPDGTRVPIRGETTLGRAPGNQLRLDDPAVSRRHARVVEGQSAVDVVDLDSSSGTFLDGHRVSGRTPAQEGQRLRIGDTHLRLESDRSDEQPGRTIVVPVGATLRVRAANAAGMASVELAAPVPVRPRMRSGWALKRLDAAEGSQRFVLADLRGGRFLRFSESEAELLQRLDGRLTVPELVADVEKAHGMGGVQRLVELLAELSDCELLADCAAEAPVPDGGSRRQRLMRPRERALAGAPDAVDRIYRAGGFACFSVPALALIAAVIAAGAAAFVAVATSGEVRPLHVAGHLSVGAVAFLAGRLAVVTLHELGHALTLASFGRRARRIGLKLVLVFPYGFVDTSEAWFEPRRRRIAVSAAGPITDGFLAGIFSLVALAGAGSARSVAFQLALGAYLGMLLNLNPLLERDGYHVLVDLLREPDLRRRARAQLASRLAGRSRGPAEPRSVALYSLATLGWSLVAAGFAAAMALRFADRVIGDASLLAWALAAIALGVALVPVVLTLAPPLRHRRLRREPAR